MSLNPQPFSFECRLEQTRDGRLAPASGSPDRNAFVEQVDAAIEALGANGWWMPSPPKDCPNVLWRPLELNTILTYLRAGRYTATYRHWTRVKVDFDGAKLLVQVYWQPSALDQNTFVPLDGARSDLVHRIYERAGTDFADQWGTEYAQAVALDETMAHAVLDILDADIDADTPTWDYLSHLLELFTTRSVTEKEAEYAVGLARSWGGTHVELLEAARALVEQEQLAATAS